MKRLPDLMRPFLAPSGSQHQEPVAPPALREQPVLGLCDRPRDRHQAVVHVVLPSLEPQTRAERAFSKALQKTFATSGLRRSGKSSPIFKVTCTGTRSETSPRLR